MLSTAPRTATYWIVAIIVRLFMVGAATISFMHIVHTSTALGLTWEAWTVPFLIDGLAVLGMIGRSARFAGKTQRAGLRLMVGAGALSLACNVYAGENLGQRLYGVLIVAGFVTAEWYASKLTPATVTAAPTIDADLQAKRSAAAVKAAATRKANKAAAVKADKAEARRLARQVRDLEHSFAAADAPVSPAPGEAAAYL